MNETVNLNNNLSECIVQKAHWGYTTYVNICTGKETDVAWTGGDIVFGAVVGLVFIGILAFLVVATKETLKD